MQTYQTDVVVIGAGAIGSAIARELSKYDVDVMLIEKNEDVGGDASKSNSATIVSGYDAPNGSLEAKLSVASNAMFDQVTKELDVHFRRIGAIQVAFTDEDVKVLEANKKKAIANGVFDVEILSGEKVREMEPMLSKDIKAGLLIPKESLVDVFEYMTALVENAVDNGVRLMTSTKALEIRKEGGKVRSVLTDKGEIFAEYVMRDNIGGIVHAHTPFLSAYAICAKPFESFAHAEMLWDHKRVEVVPYGRPGSDDIYKGADKIFQKGRDICLLANHGVLAVGEDVFAALNKLESVENACRICTIAKLVGEPANLPEEEVQLLLSL